MEYKLDEIIEKHKDKAIIYTMLEATFYDSFISTIKELGDEKSAVYLRKLFIRMLANLTDEDYRDIATALSARNNFCKITRQHDKIKGTSYMLYGIICLYIKKRDVYKQLELKCINKVNKTDLVITCYDLANNMDDDYVEENPLMRILIEEVKYDERTRSAAFGSKDEKTIERKVKEIKSKLPEAMFDIFYHYCNMRIDASENKWSDKLKSIQKESKLKTSEIRKLKSENKQLLSKNDSLTKKLDKINSSNLEAACAKNYEEEYQEVLSELFVLQHKYTRINERLHYLESAMKNSDEVEELIELQKGIEEERDDNFDLSKFKIVVVGDGSRLHIDNFYKQLDYDKRPNGIGICDNADVVIIMTNFMTHSSFFGIKTYCKNHGIKFRYCSVAGVNMKTIEAAIRHEAVEVLK